jgi:hypothetical protein
VAGLIDDLGRTFFEVGAGEAFDPDQAAMITVMTGKATLWDDVLAHPRAVLLGEAGTGKTAEFRLQRRRCRSAGTLAFFARIEDLADHGLEWALEPVSDWAEFQAWKTRNEPAVFLLDSVDEARLKGKDFRLALRRLARELGSAAAQATVLISCRVSDWQAHADRGTVAESLPPPPKPKAANDTTAKDEEPAVRVFAFAPLSQPQQRRLCAEVHGLKNGEVDGFLQAVFEVQAEHFLDRPRDVEWMVGHWRSSGRIGSLTEVLETNVRRKLAEPRHLERPLHAELTPDRLMAGARSLAAAVTFARKAGLRLPDHGPGHDEAPDALDPAEVLTDWTGAERRELLSRALFDESTYGRVRFHHRSVVEYLTARWLADRLAAECAPAEVEGLLFPQVYGRTVAAPSLAPAAAWLAGWDERIRRRALAAAPHILVHHGDPRALPLDARVAILTETVERMHAAAHEAERPPAEALHRFSAGDLAPTVRMLYDRFRDGEDITCLLLRLIHHGAMSDCADIALKEVVAGRSDVTRGCGLLALKAVGGQTHKAAVADALVADPTTWNEENLSTALEICVPDDMGLEQFLGVIEAVDGFCNNYNFEATALNALIQHRIPSNWLPGILSGFLDLLDRRFYQTEIGRLNFSRNHVELRGALAKALIRLLDETVTAALPQDTAIRAIVLLETTHWLTSFHQPVSQAIRDAVAGHLRLKRALVWHVAAEVRRKENRPPKAYSEILWRSGTDCWVLGEADIPWLLDDIASLSDRDDRLVALECVLEIWFKAGRADEILTQIRAAAGDEPEVAAKIAWWTEPPSREEPRQVAQQQIREQEKREKAERFQRELLTQLDEIRLGAYLGLLVRLRREMKGDDSRLARIDTASLVLAYGENVAQAVREGLKRCWRDWAQSKQNIPEALALSGIAIEIEDGLDIAALSVDEVRVAAEIALREINGFPPWMGDLARFHPDVVRQAVAPELDRAWAISEEHSATKLNHIVYAEEALRDLMATDVLERLETGRPASVYATRLAVSLVEKSAAVPRDRLHVLAERNARAVGDAATRMSVWFPLWMSLDGPAALNFLKDTLTGLPDEAADTAIMELCDVLQGHFRHFDHKVGDLPADLPSLTRLVAVLYRHVRIADDIRHNGAFRPERRDHAQDVRGVALSRLCETPGKETHDALLGLADRLANVADPEVFRRLAFRRAAADGDPKPWAPGDVPTFERENEAVPTAAADLHRIALRRLNAVREDLENGDFSVRTLFGKQTDEADVQSWLADKLRDRAGHRYVTTREEQVDRSKRTDIRLHNSAFAGPVCIEIKVMEKGWTVPDLESALEHQLVGQYLRDHRSRHGILLLFRTGAKKRWQLPVSKEWVDFAELLAHLTRRAAEVLTRYSGVDQLDVIGMDAGDLSRQPDQ